MLTGVRIYSSDTVWRQILRELNADVLETPTKIDLNFEDLNIKHRITPLELKEIIIRSMDNDEILQKIFGYPVHLSRIKSQILIALYKTGGMTGAELKNALGYAPNTSTHTIDTAIYQLRRTYGNNFIENTNGVYSIGKL